MTNLNPASPRSPRCSCMTSPFEHLGALLEGREQTLCEVHDAEAIEWRDAAAALDVARRRRVLEVQAIDEVRESFEPDCTCVDVTTLLRRTIAAGAPPPPCPRHDEPIADSAATPIGADDRLLADLNAKLGATTAPTDQPFDAA
jgi:hypothetical protein